MAGHVARMEEIWNGYKTLARKPEPKRPLGRRRHRWEDNMRMDLKRKRMGRCGVDASGSG